jgi:hypothetical protein
MSETSVHETAKTIVSLYDEQATLTKEHYYAIGQFKKYLTEEKPYLGEFTVLFSGSDDIDLDKLRAPLFNTMVNHINQELQQSGLKLSYSKIERSIVPNMVSVTFHLKK